LIKSEDDLSKRIVEWTRNEEESKAKTEYQTSILTEEITRLKQKLKKKKTKGKLRK